MYTISTTNRHVAKLATFVKSFRVLVLCYNFLFLTSLPTINTKTRSSTLNCVIAQSKTEFLSLLSTRIEVYTAPKIVGRQRGVSFKPHLSTRQGVP